MNRLPSNAIYEILLSLEPIDLLSLYLTDNSIKNYLNDGKFLNHYIINIRLKLIHL